MPEHDGTTALCCTTNRTQDSVAARTSLKQVPEPVPKQVSKEIAEEVLAEQTAKVYPNAHYPERALESVGELHGDETLAYGFADPGTAAICERASDRESTCCKLIARFLTAIKVALTT